MRELCCGASVNQFEVWCAAPALDCEGLGEAILCSELKCCASANVHICMCPELICSWPEEATLNFFLWWKILAVAVVGPYWSGVVPL